KSAQIREILISESAWEEMTCLFAPSLTRRAAVLMRSYLSGLMENWLFAPDSFDLEKEARDYVAILLEMYQFCPTLRAPSEVRN
ncbi:hypothetical protein POW16_10065, partial [Raoultella planticola]